MKQRENDSLVVYVHNSTITCDEGSQGDFVSFSSVQRRNKLVTAGFINWQKITWKRSEWLVDWKSTIEMQGHSPFTIPSMLFFLSNWLSICALHSSRHYATKGLICLFRFCSILYVLFKIPD